VTRAAPLPSEGPSARLLSVAAPIGGSSGTGPPSGAGAEAHERRGISRVNSKRLVHALCADILRPERNYPIVGLTCRTREYTPALDPERVREVVGPNVPIYVIEQREARVAFGLLPDRLAAYNGAARVWWPGVDEDAEPSWHPLIYDSTGSYGDDVIARLAHEFEVQSHDTIGLTPREQAALRLRSVPRPSQASSGDAREPEPIELLATRKDLRRLMHDLRRGDRDYPIVVLTFRDGDDQPGFQPDAIRPALDPRVPIYVLGTQDLCRRLSQSLGPKFAVGNGNARIMWPGVREDSDPADHPLVPADGDSDRDPTDRLIGALELSRPSIKVHVEDMCERLQAVERQAADSHRELRESRTECRMILERAQAAESRLATAEQQLTALKLAGLDDDELEMVAIMDSGAIMQRLIFREWLTSLQPDDRSTYPLGGYRLASAFIASVEDRRIATPRTRIAFACAMVACGRAGELPGLEPHPWREGKMSGGGGDPQAMRADGGKALMCNLGHGRGAARLFYWVLPDGNIEFEAVRNHDAIARS
jgi:hypothetical protein